MQGVRVVQNTFPYPIIKTTFVSLRLLLHTHIILPHKHNCAEYQYNHFLYLMLSKSNVSSKIMPLTLFTGQQKRNGKQIIES